MSLFLAVDACLSWSLPSITEQQVSPHRLPIQLCIAWLKNHWPDQAFFKHSPHANSISNSAVLHKNYISLLSDLCACIHVKKNGIVKEAIVLQWVVRITSCDFKPGKSNELVHCSVKNAVLCENHCERVTQIWTSPSEEEEKHFGCLVTFWFGTFAMLLAPLGVLFVMKTLKDER